jgi:hypothetical protein
MGSNGTHACRKRGQVTSSRIILTRLARAVITVLEPSSPLPPRPKMNLYADSDHPERGDVTGWVIGTILSAVLVAALLMISGPALEVLFNPASVTVGP